MGPLADLRRRPWAALYLALAGLLCQVLFAVPASTRMAAEQTGGFGEIICTAGGAKSADSVAGHSEHAKRHICDLCVAAAAAAVATTASALVGPRDVPGARSARARTFHLSGRSESGYLSRAPPLFG